MSASSDVCVVSNTDGSYSLRIENDDGIKEFTLMPDEFAKAVTGTLAKSHNSQAEICMVANTNGTYSVRAEDRHGIKDITLTPTEFAKAITGKLAKGTCTASPD